MIGITVPPVLWRLQRGEMARSEVGVVVWVYEHTGTPQVWLFQGSEFPPERDAAPYRRSETGMFLERSLLHH